MSRAYETFLAKEAERPELDPNEEYWASNKDLLFEFCCRTIKSHLANARALTKRRRRRRAGLPSIPRRDPRRRIQAKLLCRQILDSLPEKDAWVLELRFVKDRSYEWIGEKLGISYDAARRRASRAVGRARDMVQRSR